MLCLNQTFFDCALWMKVAPLSMMLANNLIKLPAPKNSRTVSQVLWLPAWAAVRIEHVVGSPVYFLSLYATYLCLLSCAYNTGGLKH